MSESLGINRAYQQPETPDKKHPILDRCWASHISAIGGILGVLGGVEIIRGRYGRAALLAGFSAIMDFGDGIEARRFARRNPEEGRTRHFRGGWEDQIWDRVRNIGLGGAVLTVKEVPATVKAVVAGVVIKEAVSGVVGMRTLANHYVQEREGWPAPVPSADRGRESMWWLGGGLSGVALGAKVSQNNPELGQQISQSAGILLAVGLGRGALTIPEYSRVMSEMAELTPEQHHTYDPNYQPHIVGRVKRIHGGIRSSLQNFNDPSTFARN